MKVEGIVDLHYLYANGFCRSKIDQQTADKMFDFFAQEEWRLDYEASFPVYDPKWDIGRSVTPKEIPQCYKDFANAFINSGYLDPYKKLFGEFSTFNVALHRTPKGYANAWHGHFMDGFHLHVLFHFAREKREDVDGGRIEFGFVIDPSEYSLDLHEFNQLEAKNVFRTGSFHADHGYFEILLNSHPMYRHQVTEVMTDKERYTLMLILGYKDNILIEKAVINNI